MKLLETIILEEVKKQFGDAPKMGDIKPTDEPTRPGMNRRPKDGMDIKQHKDMMWINESAGDALQPALQELCQHAQKELGFDQPVTVRLREDAENAKDLLGLTGHYSPSKKEIVVFTTNRHPKDIMRSVAHELVHHMQNCRGDFGQTLKEGYAQEDMHLREMEREAFEKGNMIFRDWCDHVKDNRDELLDETNAVGGGGIVGYTGPLGMDTSEGHELMWSGDKPLKESKMVKIYRALPASASTIRPNDYITMGRKFATEHAVTSAIYNDEPFAVVMKMVPAEHVVPADNPGEYRWGGEEIKVRPLLIADTDGNVTRAPMSEERIKKNSKGADLFQMGSSLPDELYNNKNGKPSRDPGIGSGKKKK